MPFKGLLDDLRVYSDKVLTTEEIYDYYISIAGIEEHGEDPGEEPGEDPGKEQGKEPGEDPEKEPGKDPNEEPGDSRDPAYSNTDGQVLPKTATNSWNRLLLASVFLVIAAWLFRVQKKMLKTK